MKLGGKHFNIKAPVTGSVTTSSAVVVGFVDGTEIANFNSRWVDTVAVHHDNIVCSSGSNIYIWSDGQKKPKIHDHPSTVGGLAFDYNGKRLAVSCYGGVTVWERGERRWKSSRLVWKGSHSKICFSPDGKYIVTTIQESEIHLSFVLHYGSFKLNRFFDSE